MHEARRRLVHAIRESMRVAADNITRSTELLRQQSEQAAEMYYSAQTVLLQESEKGLHTPAYKAALDEVVESHNLIREVNADRARLAAHSFTVQSSIQFNLRAIASWEACMFIDDARIAVAQDTIDSIVLSYAP
jgi:hypothetical protein